MDKKIIAIAMFAILVVGAGAILLFGSNKPDVPITSVGAVIIDEAPASGTANSRANCGADQNCLRSNFIACSPAEFSTPFVQGDYAIKVLGIEGGRCRYALNTLASDIGCSLPKELMTGDRFGHLFGQDKAPGKEQVLAQQNALDSSYCNETLKQI